MGLASKIGKWLVERGAKSVAKEMAEEAVEEGAETLGKKALRTAKKAGGVLWRAATHKNGSFSVVKALKTGVFSGVTVAGFASGAIPAVYNVTKTGLSTVAAGANALNEATTGKSNTDLMSLLSNNMPLIATAAAVALGSNIFGKGGGLGSILGTVVAVGAGMLLFNQFNNFNVAAAGQQVAEAAGAGLSDEDAASLAAALGPEGKDEAGRPCFADAAGNHVYVNANGGVFYFEQDGTAFAYDDEGGKHPLPATSAVPVSLAPAVSRQASAALDDLSQAAKDFGGDEKEREGRRQVQVPEGGAEGASFAFSR